MFLEIWSPDGVNSPPSAQVEMWLGWLRYGHFAVTVFIVLSGFCLALPILKQDRPCLAGGAGTFYKRRAWRICPTYYCALIFSLILVATCIGAKTGTHWDSSTDVTWRSALVTTFFLSDFLFGSINHVFWSVALELKIYVLFPALVWLWRRVGIHAATGLVGVAAYSVVAAFRHLFVSHLDYVAIFMAGAWAAAVAQNPDLWKKLRGPVTAPLCIVLGAGLLCAIALRLGWQQTLDHVYYLDGVAGATAAVFLLWMARSPGGRLRRILEWRPFAAVGVFSYSLYLIHAPLIQVVWQYLIDPFGLTPVIQFGLLVTLGLPGILGCSYVFYLLFERRFVRLRPEGSGTLTNMV